MYNTVAMAALAFVTSVGGYKHFAPQRGEGLVPC
jgi:hypothetical protein